jgi:primosomal protein N' (replication factor Y) (superfamily II helicase)
MQRGLLAAAERTRRGALRLPPWSAMASVSGEAAAGLVAGLPPEVEVMGDDAGRFLLRAPDATTLADALAAAPRPPGRLRVEVGPRRV